jgi:hypothetical protein
MAQNAVMSKWDFCKGNYCLWESIEQSYYFNRSLAFKSRKYPIIKVFLNDG